MLSALLSSPKNKAILKVSSATSLRKKEFKNKEDLFRRSQSFQMKNFTVSGINQTEADQPDGYKSAQEISIVHRSPSRRTSSSAVQTDPNPQPIVEIDEEITYNNETNYDNSSDSKSEKNSFQLRKSIVAGMMDITLLASNANQLKYIMAHNMYTGYNVVCAIFISLSILLQMICGFVFIIKVCVDQPSNAFYQT